MNEKVSLAEIEIESIEFDFNDNDWQIVAKEVGAIWEYSFELDCYKSPHLELPNRDILECIARVECFGNKREKLFEIGATTNFYIKKLKRKQVDETLWVYLMDTNYVHLKGHFAYYTKDTPLETKTLPHINFKQQSNINRHLDDLWK